MYNFTYNNASIFYKKEGAGFPVVFLHGFAEDSDVWRFQSDFLKRYFTLLIPDLPGSGQSQMLVKTDEKNILISDYADCMYALLLHENIDKCIVLGHSMGGYIALALAEKYPDIVKAFGFVHSTAFADSDEKKAVRLKGINTIEQYGGSAFIKSTTPNLFSKEYKTTNAGDIESLTERGKNFSKEALQQYYKAMMLREDKTPVLRNSKVPVLFIIGKQDNAAPLADLLQQAYLPSISYIYVLEKTGHMGMWEASDDVNKHLLQFIQDIS